MNLTIRCGYSILLCCILLRLTKRYLRQIGSHRLAGWQLPKLIVSSALVAATLIHIQIYFYFKSLRGI